MSARTSSIASAVGAQSPAPGTSVASAPAAQARRSAVVVRPASPRRAHRRRHLPRPWCRSPRPRARAPRRRRRGPGRCAPRAPRVITRCVTGQCPVARLGFVDDHDVGRRRPDRPGRGSAPDGGGVDDHRGPDRAGLARGGDGGRDRHLQLDEQHLAVGDDGAGGGRSQREMSVGAGCHHDHVLAVVVDQDHRTAAGDRAALAGRRARRRWRCRWARNPAPAGSVPTAPTNCTLGAGAGRRHRLIAALAARGCGDRGPQNRLPGVRQRGDAKELVDVHAAHHAHPGHSAKLAPTWGCGSLRPLQLLHHEARRRRIVRPMPRWSWES